MNWQTQRAHFITIAREVGVPVDAVLMLPTLQEMQRRVRQRTGHPGGFMGEGTARVIAESFAKLRPPAHAEGFTLITPANSPEMVGTLTQLYSRVHTRTAPPALPAPPATTLPPLLRASQHLGDTSRPLPALLLGTMELRADAILPMLEAGFPGCDTAPTYGNESAVGKAMEAAATSTPSSGDPPSRPYLVCKVPGKATSGAAVRASLTDSLRKLQRSKTDLLLLHWPQHAIEAGTLQEVWSAMEEAMRDGQCDDLGVCNFTPKALETLLPLCTRPPKVNQVERHVLLPQWELLDWCLSHGIVVQAHTPLGIHAAIDRTGWALVRVGASSCIWPSPRPRPSATSLRG